MFRHQGIVLAFLVAGVAAISITGCPMMDGGNNQNNNNDNTGGTGSNAPSIVTVVGTGLPGNNGDGMDPLDSQIYFPVDVAFGPDERLWVVDWNNHRIRRISDQNTIETIVGTGELTGDLQEEGLAREAKLNHPTNIYFEPDGNMLIAAWHNSQVTRVTLTAEQTGDPVMNIVIAGIGGREFGGDGGPAKEASFNLPSSVVEDSAGNVIVCDQANQRIRRIDANTGIVETVCNDSGTGGFSGDGGPALTAQIKLPAGQSSAPSGRLAIDNFDNIYIADTENHRIRKIDSLGMISTVVGTGEPGFNGDNIPALEAQLNTPSDVEVIADGTLIIADTYNNRIRKVTPDGIITTIAGNGNPPEDTNGDGLKSNAEIGDGEPATAARLNRPFGVAISPNGEIYIADTYNNRIRRITNDSVDAGDDNVDQFEEVEIIPCDDETIGSICTYAGTGQIGFNDDGKDRRESVIYWPLDIEFTPSGKVYLIDWNNHKIREVLPDDTLQTVVGGQFIGDGAPDFSDLYTVPGTPLGTEVNLNHPTDLMELDTGELVITVWHNHKIRVYDPVTKLVEVVMGDYPTFVDDTVAYEARANLPGHSVMDSKGNLFFTDQKNWRIRVIENFATEREQAHVRTLVGNGTHAPYVEGTPLSEASFGWPGGPNPENTGGLAIDPNNDLVFYFADNEGAAIYRLEFFDEQWSDGEITRVVGTGVEGWNGDGPALETNIYWPQDLEFGPDGNLYFNDTNNYVVRRLVFSTGMIETVAGRGGEKGYAGDGGLATEALLDRAFGVAFDAEGDLYVSDTFNGRIRKVNLNLATSATDAQ